MAKKTILFTFLSQQSTLMIYFTKKAHTDIKNAPTCDFIAKALYSPTKNN